MLSAAFFCLAAIAGAAEPTNVAGPAAVNGFEAFDGGDIAAARDAWRRAAEAGDAEAQTALADLYAQGLTLPQDDATAAAWYRRAALSGNAVAQLNLGEFYEAGRGVPQDRAEAYYWYGLAARSGSRWASAAMSRLAAALPPAGLDAARRRLQDALP